MFGPRTYGGILEVNGGLPILLATDSAQLLVTQSGENIQGGVTAATSYVGLQCANLQWLTTANFEALITVLSESQRFEPLSTTGCVDNIVRQTLPRAATALEI